MPVQNTLLIFLPAVVFIRCPQQIREMNKVTISHQKCYGCIWHRLAPASTWRPVISYFSLGNKSWVRRHGVGSWKVMYAYFNLAAFPAPEPGFSQVLYHMRLLLSNTQRVISLLKQRCGQKNMDIIAVSLGRAEWCALWSPERRWLPATAGSFQCWCLSLVPHSKMLSWDGVQFSLRIYSSMCFLTCACLQYQVIFLTLRLTFLTECQLFLKFISHWLNDLQMPSKTRLSYLVFLLSYLTDWWLIYLSAKSQQLTFWGKKKKIHMNYHALLWLLIRSLLFQNVTLEITKMIDLAQIRIENYKQYRKNVMRYEVPCLHLGTS